MKTHILIFALLLCKVAFGFEPANNFQNYGNSLCNLAFENINEKALCEKNIASRIVDRSHAYELALDICNDSGIKTLSRRINCLLYASNQISENVKTEARACINLHLDDELNREKCILGIFRRGNNRIKIQRTEVQEYIRTYSTEHIVTGAVN